MCAKVVGPPFHFVPIKDTSIEYRTPKTSKNIQESNLRQTHTSLTGTSHKETIHHKRQTKETTKIAHFLSLGTVTIDAPLSLPKEVLWQSWLFSQALLRDLTGSQGGLFWLKKSASSEHNELLIFPCPGKRKHPSPRRVFSVFPLPKFGKIVLVYFLCVFPYLKY